jgi:hypothetical protein
MTRKPADDRSCSKAQAHARLEDRATRSSSVHRVKIGIRSTSPVSGIPSAPPGGMPSSKGLAVMEVCEPQAALMIVPPPPLACAVASCASSTSSIPACSVDAAAPPAAPVPKKPRRRLPASILAIAAADLFPAISIAGEPVPVEATKVYPDAKAAERAARHWCRRIALEVAALVPEPQSQDAELFTMRHRLSITNAFHRRILRANVISSILGLFLSQGRVPATCPPVPE